MRRRPNAAKTCSREEAPAAIAEESTRASLPVAHPTATPRWREADSTELTTPATSTGSDSDTGKSRDPQKPTIPTTKTTPGIGAYNTSDAAGRWSEE